MEDLQRYVYPGTGIHATWITVNEKVAVRVIRFEPAAEKGFLPLVLIVGLSTILESFKDILTDLTRDFTVYYVETREKSTSRVSGKVTYGIEALGEDVRAVIQQLSLPEDGYVLMGYSLGATAVLDTYTRLPARPACLLLMEPTPAFHYPRWGLWVIRHFAVPLYPVMRPMANWYIRHFRINTKEDMELALISQRALANADPFKLKSCVLDIAPYTVWHRLDTVDAPALIIATSKDRFHVHDEIQRLSRSLRHCGIIDMEDNKRTHSEEMGRVIRRYLKTVQDLRPGPALPSAHYELLMN